MRARRPGGASETTREIRELKRKNAELERTIEILKVAFDSAAALRDCCPSWVAVVQRTLPSIMLANAR